MRTSYSALDTYKTCPLQYKYRAIDKIRGKKTKEQVFGAVVHRALHFMAKRNPLFPTLDEVLNFYTQAWNQAQEQLGIPEKEKEFYLEHGRTLLKKFYTKNPPWNFDILDLESRFEVLIDEHTLAGIIDRIDKPTGETYEIIDYKTGRRMPAQDAVDKDLQLSIYNLGLLKKWPFIKPEQVKLSLYYLEHGEKISSKRAPEALEETKKEILNTIHEIQEREKKADFPPTPGPWCQWCPYRPICPMWKHLYQKEKTPSDEEISAIIKEYFSIKDEVEDKNDSIKMLQAKIHQYLDEKGFERVFGAEGYITRKTVERPVYDKELLKKAVKEKRKSTSLSISRKKIEEEEENES